jgi:hypothetical protein
VPGGVPVAFDSVIARALAKEPADRYPSAGDLGRAALAAAVGERASTARGSVATGAATPEEAEPTRIAPAPGATAVIAPPERTRVARPVREPEPERHDDARDATRDRPAAVKVQRGRGRKLALAATLVVLLIPAVLAVRWIAGDDGEKTGPLSASEVLTAAQSFADAYSDESATELRRVLTPDVERWPATDGVQKGRQAVVAEYQRQFAADKIERYRLEDMQVTGGRGGRAEGRYTVTRAGAAPITGRITFLMVRRDGRPQIGLIATEPRA